MLNEQFNTAHLYKGGLTFKSEKPRLDPVPTWHPGAESRRSRAKATEGGVRELRTTTPGLHVPWHHSSLLKFLTLTLSGVSPRNTAPVRAPTLLREAAWAAHGRGWHRGSLRREDEKCWEESLPSAACRFHLRCTFSYFNVSEMGLHLTKVCSLEEIVTSLPLIKWVVA